MLLSLIVNSAFGLKAETLTDCPNNSLGQEFFEAVSLSGCDLESPTSANPWSPPNQWLLVNYPGTDLIDIADSTFRSFRKTALCILSLGAVTLTRLEFQGFVKDNNVYYAVTVAASSELFATSLKFSDFAACGAVGDTTYSASLSGGVKEMLSLFDLTMTNVTIPLDQSNGIIDSGFAYIYADGLTFTKCSSTAGFRVQTDHGAQVPVFRNLVLDEMTFSSSGSPISGVSGQYFVVEKGIFKDTACLFQDQINLMYYEDTQFFGTDEATRTGLTANGGSR
jgi:hypothetical protein